MKSLEKRVEALEARHLPTRILAFSKSEGVTADQLVERDRSETGWAGNYLVVDTGVCRTQQYREAERGWVRP